MTGERDLRADCARCFALCCVAPAFAPRRTSPSTSRPASRARTWRADFRCGIHPTCARAGFPGCTVYDCFGAGQQIAQVTFGGQDWRGDPGSARPMFAAFAVMRQLHELLWYLTEALARRRPARCTRSCAARRRDRAAGRRRPGRDRRAGPRPTTGAPSTTCCRGPASWSGPGPAPGVDRRGADLSARICAAPTCGPPTCAGRC